MSQGIVLPRWLTRTRVMQMSSLDVILVMALVLKQDPTGKAVREAASRLRDKVCMEHRPKMRALARSTDLVALVAAINIVQRGTDALKILPGVAFELRLPEPPTCHYKAMRLAGDPGSRHWQCQHCTHTKPLEVSRGQAGAAAVST